MHIKSIKEVGFHIENAGNMALDMQRRGMLHRARKPDGSIVTQADIQVEDLLVDRLTTLFPQTNILTEETAREFDPNRPYTFALDPIDGTDVFSQGWPGWCISLALLDQTLTPIAGIIYAPHWDLMLFADVDQPPILNGQRLTLPAESLPPARSTLMVTSRVHRLLDMSRFPGKTRSIGSAAMHLSFPLVYPEIEGAIQMPTTYIWDIAAAHALCRAVGYRFEYFDGQELDYSTMVRGGSADDLILAGPEAVLITLRALLTKL